MDIARLRRSPVGKVVPIAGVDPRTGKDYSHFAFVPEPLPMTPVLDNETWTVVADAARELGKLQQACSYLPNPRLLITPALAKEAQATSALEGTYGALPEVLEARLPGFESTNPEIREIRGYEAMANLGFDWVTDRPITVRMICELQQVLSNSARQPTPDAGAVRQMQVLIGAEGCTFDEARFVPPPPDDRLLAGLQAWESWVNQEHDLDPIVAVALAHYQFETLHPFSDGNGRIGRLIIMLQLLRSGVIDQPVFTLSPWLLKRRGVYQDGLLELSSTGDWNPWVRFIAAGIAEQSRSHVEAAEALNSWTASVRTTLVVRHWTGTIARLVEDLTDWPVVSASWVVANYGVSPPTAQKAIDRLVDVGVLEELTGRKYARLYGATKVMSIADSL